MGDSEHLWLTRNTIIVQTQNVNKIKQIYFSQQRLLIPSCLKYCKFNAACQQNKNNEQTIKKMTTNFSHTKSHAFPITNTHQHRTFDFVLNTEDQVPVKQPGFSNEKINRHTGGALESGVPAPVAFNCNFKRPHFTLNIQPHSSFLIFKVETRPKNIFCSRAER